MANDRRQHRLFVTGNTEYHLRSDECVGVRDRASGRWIRHHAALRLCAVNIPFRGRDRRYLGRRLQFVGRGNDVLTSPVLEVGRPDLYSVGHYVSHLRVGDIDVPIEPPRFAVRPSARIVVLGA